MTLSSLSYDAIDGFNGISGVNSLSDAFRIGQTKRILSLWNPCSADF